MSAPDPAVRFAPGIDAARIAKVYAAAGRVHIGGILADDAARRAYQGLATELTWQLHFNDGDRPINLASDAFDRLPEAERAQLFTGIYANAAQRFQYVYNSFPISDMHERKEHMALYVMRVHEFLNSHEFLEFGRTVTGVRTISYVDSQGTLYRPGHFLTKHDDAIAGKSRVAAYVLNLTPKWQPDWGGILQFIAPDGHIAEGYVPVFNALNLFRVPQTHAVSIVSPFAQSGRYSITGWLREI
jgi:hypothetical protein